MSLLITDYSKAQTSVYINNVLPVLRTEEYPLERYITSEDFSIISLITYIFHQSVGIEIGVFGAIR